MDDVRYRILEFLRQYDDCVIATVSADVGNPQAATVGYTVDDELTLTIGTNKKSRKYNNILNNPNIAVVVGFEGDETVQYEGIARELQEPELSARLEKHHEKIPGARKFYDDPGQTYFAIDPSWIRITNNTYKPEVEELRGFK